MNNHNHYAPILEFKDIDFCMSKGRLSKKLTEKMLNNKNSKIKDLEQKLAKAVEGLKFYADEKNWDERFDEDSFFGHPRDIGDSGDRARQILKEIGE